MSGRKCSLSCNVFINYDLQTVHKIPTINKIFIAHATDETFYLNAAHTFDGCEGFQSNRVSVFQLPVDKINPC